MTVNFTAQIPAPLANTGVSYMLYITEASAKKLILALSKTDCEEKSSFFSYDEERNSFEVYGIRPEYAQILLDTVNDLTEEEKNHLKAAIKYELVFNIDANINNTGISVIYLNNEWTTLPEINMCWGTALDLLKEIGVAAPDNESDGRKYTAKELADAAAPHACDDTRMGRHAQSLVRMHQRLKSMNYENAEIYLG